MAKCEEGYLCEVCGQEVEGITESDLYLRYVIGEVDPEQLHTLRERHILCNPILAQFIVAEGFEQVVDVPEGFRKQELDTDYVRARETLVTRGWQRLHEMAEADKPITEYPLAEVRARWQQRGSETD